MAASPPFSVNMREGVIWAYRHLLRREPGSESDVAFHLGHTAETLRDAFVSSPEYRALTGAGPVTAGLLTVLDRFRPFSTERPSPGMWRNFLGVQTRCSFLPPDCAAWAGRVFGPPGMGGISGVHDEAEWLGTLIAVLQAAERLTVVELGAGWAPWLVNTAVAARRFGIRGLTLVGVKGSLGHVRQHFLDNGIEPDQHRLIHGVVGLQDGRAYFPRLDVPAHRYGDEADFSGGQQTAEMDEVSSFSLESLLIGLPPVDLLHCDIQGMEAEVFRAGRAIMNERVRRAVIGTHGRAVEAELHRDFSNAGWVMEADAACMFTQVGTAMVLLLDGTQVWRNPRLAGA